MRIKSYTESTNPPTYQHVVARGLPYDRGFIHGKEAKSKVQENVRYYRQPGKLAYSQYATTMSRYLGQESPGFVTDVVGIES